MRCQRKDILKYLSLIVGCMCMLTAGSIAAINAYSSDLRDTFNMTQLEISVLLAVGNLGFSSGMIPGLCIERFGSVRTSMVGLIVGTGSNLAVAGSVASVDCFSENIWAVYIGACLLGFGANFLFTNGLVTNTLNFTIFKRGRVVGILSAFFWAGSSVFSAIYEGIFDTVPKKTGDLKNYFIFTSCVFGSVALLALLFLRHIPLMHEMEAYLKEYQTEKTDEQDDCGPPLEKSISIRTKMKTEVPKLLYGDLSFTDLITNSDFHLLFWPCVFCNGIQTSVIFNLSTYFESFSLMKYIGVVTISGPLIGSLSKFFSGYLSDLTLRKLPRLWVVTTANFLQAVILGLCIFEADTASITVLLAVIHYLAIGVEMSVVPAILGDLFGVKHFGRNWGVVMFFNAVSASILQATYLANHIFQSDKRRILFSALFLTSMYVCIIATAKGILGKDITMGVLYDQQKVPGESVCYGNHCFQTSFLIFFLLTLLSFGLDVILFIKQMNKYRKHWIGLEKENREESYLLP